MNFPLEANVVARLLVKLRKRLSWRHIHKVADRFEPAFKRLMMDAFDAGRATMDRAKLERAVEQKDEIGILTLVSEAITATQLALGTDLENLLSDVRNSAAHAGALKLRAAWYDEKTGIDDHGRGQKGDKASRAKETYKPSTAAKQQWAEKNEQDVVRMTGGKSTGDNKPTDVNVKIGRKQHGVEVKTMLDNGNDKITMHPSSKARKEAWAKKNGATLHTIVIDDRKAFGSPKDSGHRIYYRRGVGSFRLHTMTKVTSDSHLKQLMAEK